ncbi:hypothetical protein BRC83_06155 [Halobacteriales archaeon QS_1_68_17]|nr:MAG: hypothetical protein BRC83_06155 [Halobacteriales archaeon QS_1_68_17]
MDRRRLLRRAGVAAVAVLAGCAEGESGDDGNGTDLSAGLGQGSDVRLSSREETTVLHAVQKAGQHEAVTVERAGIDDGAVYVVLQAGPTDEIERAVRLVIDAHLGTVPEPRTAGLAVYTTDGESRTLRARLAHAVAKRAVSGDLSRSELYERARTAAE